MAISFSDRFERALSPSASAAFLAELLARPEADRSMASRAVEAVRDSAGRCDSFVLFAATHPEALRHPPVAHLVGLHYTRVDELASTAYLLPGDSWSALMQGLVERGYRDTVAKLVRRGVPEGGHLPLPTLAELLSHPDPDVRLALVRLSRHLAGSPDAPDPSPPSPPRRGAR